MRRVASLGSAPDILYGETPYGWRLTRDRSRLVVNGDEQRVLSVVRHMYFVERIPMRDIVQRLREAGIVNRRDRPFVLSGVWELIHRRRDRPEEAVATKAGKHARAAKAAKGAKRARKQPRR